MASTLDRVIALMAKQIEKDPATLTAESSLESLGVDSFDFIEFVFLIEDEFDIHIDINYNDVTERMNTIGDVAKAVDALIAAKTDGKSFPDSETAVA